MKTLRELGDQPLLLFSVFVGGVFVCCFARRCRRTCAALFGGVVGGRRVCARAREGVVVGGRCEGGGFRRRPEELQVVVFVVCSLVVIGLDTCAEAFRGKTVVA